ncbi:MAG: plasmid stabilization protein [Brachybacterium sp.]|uniref:plasmid stabilization protein n=1 Tax=Brachybacterium sp. TaxID=1891286 RepID=UPI00264A02A8|nr:plasmid stabilization protein [Brachybacterium sp.]MDN5687836.1 plasmid stabilization protein [Brachybacterium sp.]
MSTVPEAWSDKRERQYEHVKKSRLDEGSSEEEAEEVAARTVNKTRAQEGESDEASKTSTQDKSPSERGGERSGSGPQGRTKDQLYQDAKREDVAGRSQMDKDELKEAVEQHEDR